MHVIVETTEAGIELYIDQGYGDAWETTVSPDEFHALVRALEIRSSI